MVLDWKRISSIFKIVTTLLLGSNSNPNQKKLQKEGQAPRSLEGYLINAPSDQAVSRSYNDFLSL